MAVAAAPERLAAPPDAHPIVRLIRRRLAIGVVILFLVSVVVFLATEVLPGNAATAILGHNATPARVHALERSIIGRASWPASHDPDPKRHPPG